MHLFSQVLFSTESALFVASGEDSGGFTPPAIKDFFPEPFLFQGTPFAMNRIILVRIIMMSLLLLFIFLYSTRAKLVPGRAQTSLEYLLDFCRINISEQVLGKEYARRYNGLISAIFFIVVMMNISGIIPGLNVAGSAVAGIPIILALLAWVVFIFAGVKKSGLGFFKDTLFPPGVPKFLYVLLTPIEFLSTFVIRPFTLFVRLLANMVAGHLLLGLFIVGTNYLLLSAAPVYKPFSVVTFAMALGLTCFEILVAFLQAYIFAMLTAVYIDLSVHSAH